MFFIVEDVLNDVEVFNIKSLLDSSDFLGGRGRLMSALK